MTEQGAAVALSSQRVAQTARLVASALHDDPAYAFLLPEQARPAGLEGFFRGHLGTHVPHRCSYVREDAAGDVTATVTLRPPGGMSISAPTLIRALAPFALAHGLGVLRRLSQLKNQYEHLERRAAKGTRYWHVHMMAVRPELQGKGIGGALLEEVLATTDGSAEPIVLTTHKEINVRFYQRAGFLVACKETVRLGGAEPHLVWCMRRMPRARS